MEYNVVYNSKEASMSRRCLYGVVFFTVVFLIFGITSCPGFSMARPSKPVLIFKTGNSKGTINYSWTSNDSDNNVYYTLIILKGWHDASEVIANGNPESDSTDANSGIFTGEAGEWYSAVVMADKNSNMVYSNVKQAKAKVTEEGEYDLRFGVIADTHLGSTYGAYIHSLDKRFEKALNWYNTEDVTALAIVGDITELGSQSDWKAFKNIWNTHKGELQLIAAMGNHEIFSEPVSGDTRNACVDRFEETTGQKTNAHYIINGYHFIVLSPGSGAFIDQGKAGGAIASGRTVISGSLNSGDIVPLSVKEWLRERIDMAKVDSPGKPIFVFCHWPIRDTVLINSQGGISSFGNNPLSGFFRDDPEVVFFSGHIHQPNNDPRSIWQGSFTAVNIPSLFYLGLGTGYLGNNTNGIVNADSSNVSNRPKIVGEAAGQGTIVSVKGSQVLIENYDFDFSEGYRPLGTVVKIPQIWEFDVLQPDYFLYTSARRDTQKSIPLFDDTKLPSASLNGIIIKMITDISVEVEFPQAKIPLPNLNNEVVYSYRFDFINQQTGVIDHSASQWSDFMLTPRLQKPTYTQLIGGLQPDTDYELRIYAYASFQECSSQYLTCTFKTSNN